MKFGEQLNSQLTPEWRSQYVVYEQLKALLYETVDQAPVVDYDNEHSILVLKDYFHRADETFFHLCEQELQKVNIFFAEKLAERQRKYAQLISQFEALRDETKTDRLKKLTSFASDTKTNTLHKVKLAFSEYYLSLVLLQNYQQLNFTGFRKILKKHDKLFKTDTGVRWRENNVDTSVFHSNKEVDRLLVDVEEVFANELESGDKKKAMKRLRVPPLEEKERNPWTLFRVGLYTGLSLVVFFVCITRSVYIFHVSTLHNTSEILECDFVNLTPVYRADERVVDDMAWEPTARIFRGFFLIIFHTFLIGLNICGWRSGGVNHVLIFEIDPRDHLTFQQLVEISGFLFLFWSLCLTMHLFATILSIHPFLSPLIMACGFLTWLLNPLNIFHKSARFWLLKILWRVVSAPFHEVHFADFWLADQLNSMAAVFLDFEYMVCYYIYLSFDSAQFKSQPFCSSIHWGIRPAIVCLPVWFRFSQCLRRYRDTRKKFPHLANAGKYGTIFLVVLFSTLHKHLIQDRSLSNRWSSIFLYLWLGSALASTVYAYIWDVKMDWGLLDKSADEHKLLRDQIVYRYSWYYYLAIGTDLFLRFGWTLTFTVGDSLSPHYNEVVVSSTAVAELVRRFVWNFFRLENEQLNNCGEFRAVRDIAITPIQADELERLLNIMDDDDGAEGDRRHIRAKEVRKIKRKVRIPILESEKKKSRKTKRV